MSGAARYWLALWWLAIAPAGLYAELGADLSMQPRVAAGGGRFYDFSGQPVDAEELLRLSGLTLVRLRLWHTPAEPWPGLDSTLAHAQRVVASGQRLLLDLHYSDTWADPAQQTKPAAWQALNFAQLTDSIYSYTAAVLGRFYEAGATPYAVQIGNEITNGMLWNDGRVGGEFDTPLQWNKLAALLVSAVAGVRSAIPPAEWPLVVLHLDRGGDNAGARYWLNQIASRHVLFDVIGVSYYYWWQGELNLLAENLSDLVERYGKPVWVVETAYPFTLAWDDSVGNIVGDSAQIDSHWGVSAQAQTDFIGEVLAITRAANQGRETPVFYWEPTWIAADSFGSPWENLGWFDYDGRALPIVNLMQNGTGPEPRERATAVTMRVWPNPVSGGAVLHVRAGTDPQTRLSLYDVLGREVGRFEAGAPGIPSIATGGLTAGTYFVVANSRTLNAVTIIRLIR